MDEDSQCNVVPRPTHRVTMVYVGLAWEPTNGHKGNDRVVEFLRGIP